MRKSTPALIALHALASMLFAGFALGQKTSSAPSSGSEQAPAILRHVAASLANVRAAPTDTAKLIARLPINTRVAVKRQLDAWCEVASEEHPHAAPARGYVACRALARAPVTPEEIKAELAKLSPAWNAPLWEVSQAVPRAAARQRIGTLERAFFFSPHTDLLRAYGDALELACTRCGTEGGRAEKVPPNAVFNVMKAILKQGIVSGSYPVISSYSYKTPKTAMLSHVTASEKDDKGQDLYTTAFQAWLRKAGFNPPPAKASLFTEDMQLMAFVGAPFATRVLQRAGRDMSVRWTVGATEANPETYVERVPGTVRKQVFRPRSMTRNDDVEGHWDVWPAKMQTTPVPTYVVGADRTSVGNLTALSYAGGGCLDQMESTVTLNAPVKSPLAFVATTQRVDASLVKATRLAVRKPKAKQPAVTRAFSIDLNADGEPDLLVIHTQHPEQGDGEMDPNTGRGPFVAGYSIGGAVFANIAGSWKLVAQEAQGFCT